MIAQVTAEKQKAERELQAMRDADVARKVNEANQKVLDLQGKLNDKAEAKEKLKMEIEAERLREAQRQTLIKEEESGKKALEEKKREEVRLRAIAEVPYASCETILAEDMTEWIQQAYLPYIESIRHKMTKGE